MKFSSGICTHNNRKRDFTFAFYLGLATLLDLVATYFFMGPIVKVLAKTDWFANHPKRFGLPAIGAVNESRSKVSSTLVETI